MITIMLNDVRIQAYHGIYEGEEKMGNPYIVNVEVSYDEKAHDFEDINDTINYVDLYNIVWQRMQNPTGLLEKVCERIIRRIKHQYPFVKEVTMSLHKLQAPIEHFQGQVGVRLSKKFEN